MKFTKNKQFISLYIFQYKKLEEFNHVAFVNNWINIIIVSNTIIPIPTIAAVPKAIFNKLNKIISIQTCFCKYLCYSIRHTLVFGI